MDGANFSGNNTLEFSSLTLMHDPGNLNQDTWDLFLSTSSSSLNRVLFPGAAVWDWINGDVTFSDNGNRELFRYLHFLSIPEEPGGGQLPEGATKIIFIIHGWNSGGNLDPFASAHWVDLYTNWVNATAGTDWTVFRYDWAADADTGSTLFPATDSTESAEHGHQHGQHLGDLLFERHEDLVNVQVIGHSAGSWLARGTARNLLDLNPNICVEVTILDPYMPSEIFLNDTSLSTAVMSNLETDLSGTAFYLLENYYADEITFGTNETFNWRAGVDLNYQLDGGGHPGTYDSHSGPVQWYADTVLSASGTPVANLASYDLATYGARRAMYFNEPIPILLPADTVAAIASTATVTSQFSTRDLQAFPGDSQSPAIGYQWYEWDGSDWLPVAGQTNANLEILNAQTSDSGFYRLMASNTAGKYTTESIELSIVPSGYLTWIGGFPGLPMVQWNPNDDYDGDSFDNWFEYAMDLGPLVANASPSVVLNNVAGVLELSYTRHRLDVTYTVETSTDMENWTTTGVNQGSMALGPVVASITLAPEDYRFLRLIVE